MSQEQPRRPQAEDQDPIKYGDVFNVSGDLAQKPVAPQDAAMMQSAETRVFGQTQPGGVAASMQSAARLNEQAGLVGHRDVNDITGDRGVTVMETQVAGTRIVTESVGGQVVGQYVQPISNQPAQAGAGAGAAGDDAVKLTIGEALEATAHTVGDKPVEQSDAAAIQAAEMRATGRNEITPGGLAAMAQSAAAYNSGCAREEDKIKMSDIMSGATARLAADKPATRQDAEGVVGAEMRNNPNVMTTPGGVAASVVAAARLNEKSANQ
ncbi:late embryogenesis abundant protein D-34-like [Neltuma alba]|uniref:late embryogenesis abundant protein D-34-like n=1 Tax=Neltuma alba TaxID=207710 RepID=UPI0010A47D37|nr:late embryogenesis abundant protein D-34-like [Prosopis alba]